MDELNSLETNFAALNAHDEEKMKEEIQFLEFQNKTLTEFLQGVTDQGEGYSAKRYFSESKE